MGMRYFYDRASAVRLPDSFGDGELILGSVRAGQSDRPGVFLADLAHIPGKMKGNGMEKAKHDPFGPFQERISSRRRETFSGQTRPLLTRRAEAIRRRKELSMNKIWKKIFFLDFEKSFYSSCGKLLLVWNPLWTLIVTIFLGNHSLASILFRWGWNFLEATIVCFLGLVIIRIYLLGEKVWASKAAKNLPRHGTGWYMFFLAFLAPPGLFVALRFMVAGINFFYAGEPIAPTFQWQYYGTEIFWVWALLLVCFLFKSWQDLRDSVQQNQLRTEELEKERLQAVLTKLKDQMNPHFLVSFRNTLNTVASLIPADPAKAEQVVVKLSGLFQGILTATRKTYHSLEKEMEFCRDYLDIEKSRFGPRLESRIEIEKGLDPARVLIPVLLLQPLVENAVKHGLSSRATGGHIWIKARLNNGKMELLVEDDGVGFGNSPYAGSGTALENCRKRLELGFGKRSEKMEIARREAGGTTVLLVWPVMYADYSVEGGQVIRALIVDDEAPARSRLARMLSEFKDIQVIGEASNGLEALQASENLKPGLSLSWILKCRNSMVWKWLRLWARTAPRLFLSRLTVSTP